MSALHCENITFPSSDRKHTSSAVIYTCPDVPVRAVIQLSHGMCEYVRRYAPMADFYAAHGIALAGNDHLGHGDTAQAGEHGHYGEKDGRFHLLDDLHTMNSLLHERFPGLPIICAATRRRHMPDGTLKSGRIVSRHLSFPAQLVPA